jgi:hypothetical protein
VIRILKILAMNKPIDDNIDDGQVFSYQQPIYTYMALRNNVIITSREIVSEDRVLKRIFGTKRSEITGNFRKIRN